MRILLDGLVQNGDAYWYVFMTEPDRLYNNYFPQMLIRGLRIED